MVIKIKAMKYVSRLSFIPSHDWVTGPDSHVNRHAIGMRSSLFALVICGWMLHTDFVCAETRFIEEAKGEFRSVDDRAHISISGHITDQDAVAVNRLIGTATDKSFFTMYSGAKQPHVFLNSLGGNLLAAIEIGRTLRKHAAVIWVGDTDQCASACVFILAGGVRRNVAPGAHVALHRPYFEGHHFAELSSTEAQSLYRKLIDTSKEYLKDMGMPDILFEQMLRIPSQKAELLTASDLDSLRLDGKDPAFEEWDRANAEKAFGKDRFRQIEDFNECLNSDTPQAVCEARYNLRFKKHGIN